MVLLFCHIFKTTLHFNISQLLTFHFEILGRAFNVGDESMNMTKEQVAKKIQNFIPKCNIEIGQGEDKDQRDYDVSYSRIRKLGFKSTISLDSGIKELVSILPQMSPTEILLSKNI